MSTFRVIAAPDGHGSEVYLDGVKLSDLKKATVHIEEGQGTLVALEFSGAAVIVDGDADVKQSKVSPAKGKA